MLLFNIPFALLFLFAQMTKYKKVHNAKDVTHVVCVCAVCDCQCVSRDRCEKQSNR